MKNIHILPTDKPSRLHFWNRELKLEQVFLISKMNRQHTYITNNEEIKNGDYKYDTFHKQVSKVININSISKYDSKIILTTDQDLIKDGVQAIDDEFLEWFVKNPSCDYIEIESQCLVEEKCTCNSIKSVCKKPYYTFNYEIIIPKEEPKQETLEEVAETQLYITINKIIDGGKNLPKGYSVTRGQAVDYAFKIALEVAKWQQQQNNKLYSEEEVYQKLHNLMTSIKLDGLVINDDMDLKRWFNQNKKK